jgi:hypothetical protein
MILTFAETRIEYKNKGSNIPNHPTDLRKVMWEIISEFGLRSNADIVKDLGLKSYVQGTC